MSVTGWCRRACVAAVFAASLPLSAQLAPSHGTGTPTALNPQVLLGEIRRRVHLALDARPTFAYAQRETEVKLDGDGRPTSKATREYEVIPSPVDLQPYKRLVARNGVPVPAAELRENDRKRQSEMDARVRDLSGEAAAERERRARREAEERREQRTLVDEAFRLFDYRVLGTESVGGRPAIAIGFSARPGLTTSNRYASFAQKFAGKAWVDQQDLEVVRVDAQAVDDITYGLGLFARVYKGTTVRWERAKVDPESWMPARLEIRADARVLLFRRVGLFRVTDYFNYRKLPLVSSAWSLMRQPGS